MGVWGGGRRLDGPEGLGAPRMDPKKDGALPKQRPYPGGLPAPSRGDCGVIPGPLVGVEPPEVPLRTRPVRVLVYLVARRVESAA